MRSARRMGVDMRVMPARKRGGNRRNWNPVDLDSRLLKDALFEALFGEMTADTCSCRSVREAVCNGRAKITEITGIKVRCVELRRRQTIRVRFLKRKQMEIDVPCVKRWLRRREQSSELALAS